MSKITKRSFLGVDISPTFISSVTDKVIVPYTLFLLFYKLYLNKYVGEYRELS
jgi:hypothetical protein